MIERGDALVLAPLLDRVGVGADEEQTPLGDVGARGPDLLAVEDVVVAVLDRERAQVGQVAPASGSEKPWHQWSSALRMLGTQRSFCSSVPQRMIMGPICHSPLAL